MSMKTKLFVRCSSVVDKSAVRRENRNGVEHIIVSSKTLPDNVVMNGIMYPAEEISNSFQTLERTFAPIGHPTDANGDFLPASDPDAIHNFHGGAFNENVRRENGRVLLDKVINVEEAKKTERGLRLLERINELETNENPRPIHTSTGVFLEVQELEEPKTNASGHSFQRVAANMTFDHDAILLDDVGAAVPEQGVGMAVNQDIVSVPASDLEELSHDQIRDMLYDAINTPPLSADWIVGVFESKAIYELNGELFEVPYTIGNNTVTIAGIPRPVVREISFTPRTNKMKELIINALKEAGVETDGLDEGKLLEAYNKLQEPKQEDSPASKQQDIDILKAVKNLADTVEGLKTELRANENAELQSAVDAIIKSGAYPGLDAESAKALGLKTLKNMAAALKPSYALPVSLAGNSDNEGDGNPLNMNFDMPA